MAPTLIGSPSLRDTAGVVESTCDTCWTVVVREPPLALLGSWWKQPPHICTTRPAADHTRDTRVARLPCTLVASSARQERRRSSVMTMIMTRTPARCMRRCTHAARSGPLPRSHEVASGLFCAKSSTHPSSFVPSAYLRPSGFFLRKSSIHSDVTDLGRSRGRPRPRSQKS